MNDTTPMNTQLSNTPRTHTLERTTAETTVALTLSLDGTGKYDIDTGVPFLDHMLAQLAKHARFSLDIRCKGDVEVDDHHSVEDVGIALGAAFNAALGDKRGIARYGDAYAPLDEALSRAVVDCSGRPGFYGDVVFPTAKIGHFDTELIAEFLRAFAFNAHITLHADTLRGANAHHMAESLFKALARALRFAVLMEDNADIPSTKGVL